MNIKSADDLQLRQYLLGILPEKQCDEIEQKLLADDDFGRAVELVEDEIVDDYLDGALNKQDKGLAEKHFFQAPEHRSKLHFARLLRCHLNTKQSIRLVRPAVFAIPRPFVWVASTAIVCLLMLSTGEMVYIGRLRRDLESEVARNRQDESTVRASLEQERLRANQFQEEVRLLKIANNGVQPLSHASSVILTLLPLSRGDEHLQQVRCSSGTKSVEIHIPLLWAVQNPDRVNNPMAAKIGYRTTLLDANGKEVWSINGLQPNSISGVFQLVFAIPCRLLSTGDYSVAIKGQTEEKPKMYFFHVG